MSIGYEEAGRTRQKQRTRGALVKAARELVAEGVTPTVDTAAAKATISRTTAYRYFPNQHALLAAAYPLIDMSSLLSSEPAVGPEARLESTVDALTRLVAEHEPELRTMFRLSLDPDFAQRGELVLPEMQRRYVWRSTRVRTARSLSQAVTIVLVTGTRPSTRFVWVSPAR